MAATDIGSGKQSKSLSASSSTSSAGSSTLDDRVQGFVSQIYEEASKTLSRQIRTPLGALDTSQIDKGYEKLEQIRKAIQYNDRRLLTALSSQFYSLIPQRFPSRIDPDSVRIDTDDKADRQEELLQLMRDVHNVKGSLHREIDEKYAAINTSIIPVEQSNPEYERLERKVYDSHSSHHNVRLAVNQIFAVDLQSVKGRFNPRNLQTKELFHGSANKNILGILQRGLLISPPCAQFTGAAFGRGIYFASHSTKSAQYSTKFYSNIHDNGFLFIADVAVGKMEKVRSFDFRSGGSRRGYDSVWAIAGADLIHDEFIVYNPDQVELRYVIDFSPKSRRGYW